VPLTLTQHEKSLQDPAICELLPVRDYLDNVMVRIDGSLVAGYELNGLTTYFASDEGRDRGKLMLEAYCDLYQSRACACSSGTK
jgi:hypothetical protein